MLDAGDFCSKCLLVHAFLFFGEMYEDNEKEEFLLFILSIDAIRIGCHRVLENGNISLLTKLAENFSASEDEVRYKIAPTVCKTQDVYDSVVVLLIVLWCYLCWCCIVGVVLLLLCMVVVLPMYDDDVVLFSIYVGVVLLIVLWYCYLCMLVLYCCLCMLVWLC